MGQIKRKKHGPEWFIQNAIRDFLESRGWHVERMIGNALQVGIPDLNAAHPTFGERWIDVKQPGRYSFTTAQKRKWPLWEKFGRCIWILTAADQANYDLLFGPPNWRDYWKASWGEIPDIDALITELQNERRNEAGD